MTVDDAHSKTEPEIPVAASGDYRLASALMDLVGVSRQQRLSAGDSIMEAFSACAGTDQFGEMIRKVVRSDGFPATEFATQLLIFRQALHRDWMERVDAMSQRDERLDQRQDDLLETIAHGPGHAERERAGKRFTRLLCASIARDERISRDAESMKSSAIAAHVVTETLGTELLAAGPVLIEALRGDEIGREGMMAVERMGPGGIELADALFEMLDELKGRGAYELPRALGSVVSGSEPHLRRLIERLSHPEAKQRSAAAEALARAAPDLAGLSSEALDALRPLLGDIETRADATAAVASVGRRDRDALAWLLELASARPPRVQRQDRPLDIYEWDQVMVERGWAITALSRFTEFASEVVPVLIDAFDTFEEYDPDRTYRGDHERVCESLCAFGQAAAPAVPWVVAFLERWEEQPEEVREWPTDKFE
ncbi:MAG: hypothetical protein AAF078_12220, partial [Planctomycetota bacterium]